MRCEGRVVRVVRVVVWEDGRVVRVVDRCDVEGRVVRVVVRVGCVLCVVVWRGALVRRVVVPFLEDFFFEDVDFELDAG